MEAVPAVSEAAQADLVEELGVPAVLVAEPVVLEAAPPGRDWVAALEEAGLWGVPEAAAIRPFVTSSRRLVGRVRISLVAPPLKGPPRVA